MRKRVKTALVLTIGWGLITLGILAGFIPFVPGIVLIIIGIYVISFRSVLIKNKLDHFRSKNKRLHLIVFNFEEFLAKVVVFFKKYNK